MHSFIYAFIEYILHAIQFARQSVGCKYEKNKHGPGTQVSLDVGWENDTKKHLQLVHAVLSSRSVWGLVMAKIRTWSTSTVIGRQSRKIGVIEDSPGQFHREQVSSAIHRAWQRVFPCYLEGGEKDFPIKREQYLKVFTILERCSVNQIWKILQTMFLAFLIIQHFSIYFIIIVFS